MAITRAQQAKQMLQNGGMLVQPGFGGTRQGYRGSDMGQEKGPETGRAGNTGIDRDKGPVDDRGNRQQNLNQRNVVRQARVRAVEDFIDRPTFGFTDAAKFNLMPAPIKILKGLGNLFTGKPVDLSMNQRDGRGGILPLWAQLGFNSEAEYLASLQAQAQAPSNMNQEPEDPEGLRLRFMAEGGPIGGIMDIESGRQMYFLGKLVKKATRAVKKIVKSPVGKAAILGGLAYFGGGGRLPFTKAFAKEGFGGFSLENLFSLTKNPLISKGGEFSPMRAIGLASLAPLAFSSKPEEEDEEEENRGEGLDIARIRANPNQFLARRFVAEGGSMKEPVAKKTMPLLDMGGKEMDLREEGGFVPIGRMEKADDVPARLSKNEFVFTADAVRNAGDGDVDKGAEVMYNMMKNLESGGNVSEESQGLEGARKMFQTSQRLEEVL